MKRIIIFILAFLFFNNSFSENKTTKIVIKNNSTLKYANEIISVKWESIIKNNPNLTKDNFSILDEKENRIIPSQAADNDGDGKIDELLLLTSIDKFEEKNYSIITKVDTFKFESLVSLYFQKKREDIAWESDKIAYRIYGPALSNEVNNGIDIWCKRVRYNIVEKWYTHSEKYAKDGKDTYHQDTGEGADFYSVSKSLGAGSAALWKNDSLYQPGVFESYRFIESGPLRVVFEVTYKSINYDGLELKEKKIITLDAGSNLNKIELIFESKNKKKDLFIAAGIVKRKNVKSFYDKHDKIVSLWGPVNDDPVNEFLGIGIIIPGNKYFNLKDTNSHLLAICQHNSNKNFVYYSGAGWTKNGDFKNENDWINYLKDYSRKIKNKLEIKVK
jgi:pectinesterase